MPIKPKTKKKTPLHPFEGSAGGGKPKKAAKKKVAKKKPAAKKKVAKQSTEMTKADKIAIFAKNLNKKMKGVGRIDIGRDIDWIDPPRISTGILGLDIISRGGLPRGGMVNFWGPFSSSKTTTSIHCMSSAQRNGEHTMFAAAEGFSKDWARKIGLWIPYSEEEYEALKELGYSTPEWHKMRLDMQEYDQLGLDEEYGTVTVLQHIHGDGLLEAVYQAVKENLYSIIVVDSISVLKNTRQIEDAEVGDEEMGGGGQITMLNRFTAKCFSALNTKYDEEGNVDMDGGKGNLTCLICLSQARLKFGARSRPGQAAPLQPTGGQGLLHAWHFSVQFSRGEQLGENTSIDGKNSWIPHGVEIRVKGTKSKIGPEGRVARWHLYTEANQRLPVGEIDRGHQIRMWGIYYNVIAQGGAWYTLPDGTRINGKDKVDAFLSEPGNQGVLESLEEEILKRCRR